MFEAELARELHGAARAALREVLDRHAGEHLNGYALCTDDTLCTLSPVASTRESCEKSRVKDSRWLVVEWPYWDGSSFFERARQLLQESYVANRGTALDVHVQTCFTLLVDVLEGIRSEGLVGRDVLLLVEST